MEVKDVIGGELAVSTEGGDMVYERLVKSLSSGEKVELSFKGLDLITSAFLNNAIGKLYDKFDSGTLNSSLKVVGLEDDDKALLHRVIRNAKLYYQNPQKMKERYDKVLKED